MFILIAFADGGSQALVMVYGYNVLLGFGHTAPWLFVLGEMIRLDDVFLALPAL
jgi:hypothetical protein